MDNREISNAFLHENTTSSSNENPPILKRKRNLPGNPGKLLHGLSLFFLYTLVTYSYLKYIKISKLINYLFIFT
jgi:hypothetical protein